MMKLSKIAPKLLLGYKIEKGWSVNLDVVSIHHDPEIFANPEKFDPSRFDVRYKGISRCKSTPISFHMKKNT